jgi:hypothetical protein
MNALSIVQEFQARGIRFELGDSGRLVVDAPKGALDRDEIERLRDAKPAIIAVLLVKSATPDQSAHDPLANQRVAPEVAAEIRCIEAEAYRLGWTVERLWNRDFWPHAKAHPRGLASVLGPGDRIVEVNAEFIRLVCQRSALRFSAGTVEADENGKS